MTHIVPGIRPSILQLLALFGLVLLGSVVPRGVWSQTPDSLAPPPSGTKANPFSGFETHYLSNGLKVWFKQLPDAPNVSISVGVPYGWDADPRGKEELAHLTEHILFSDHDGRTEQEIKDAIDGLGGRHNGFTTPDHTWYYVTVSKEHGGFALEWLSRVISPHSMAADVVERNRQPVALEINAQPREFFEGVWALLNPSWLLPRDFWQREFQMETRSGRRYDRWASLQRITPEDVTDFYERYYVPEAMTLTVIGDLDRSEVLEIAERTFGSLIKRPAPPPDVDIEDPARGRATFHWSFGPNVRYTARHKLFNSDAEDDLMLLFVRDLLRRRLNQRLRYGEQKAVYGLQVSTTQRGPGGFLQIEGSIAENEYDFARGIIQEEIAALVEGTLPPEEFEADRTALVERLRGENSTAQALNFWVLRNFYDPSKHTDFPDLLSFFAGVTQDEVTAFAARTFVPEREVTRLVGVQPMSQGMRGGWRGTKCRLTQHAETMDAVADRMLECPDGGGELRRKYGRVIGEIADTVGDRAESAVSRETVAVSERVPRSGRWSAGWKRGTSWCLPGRRIDGLAARACCGRRGYSARKEARAAPEGWASDERGGDRCALESDPTPLRPGPGQAVTRK